MLQILHKNQGYSEPKRVFFTGTGELRRGQALCYDLGYVTTADGETAADKFAFRQNVVALPASGNNLAFAGVVAQDYPANANGQWVLIFEPGSVCDVLVDIATVLNTTRLTFGVGANSGHFGIAGLSGRGTAIALQTLAVTTDIAGTIPAVVSKSLDGSATYATATKRITKTDAFLYAKAGDFVYVMAGNKTAGANDLMTPGKYVIAERVSKDVAALATSAGAADSNVAFYCVRGYPTVLAKLLDGEESGGLEFVAAVDNAEASPANMNGGVTQIMGTTTLGTGDTVLTLADGLYPGQKKVYQVNGAALQTNKAAITSAKLTATTSAKNWAATASVKIIAAGSTMALEWNGAVWMIVGGVGICA